jgi:hypothetical protein
VSNAVVQCLIRLRLGIQPLDNMPTFCVCGHKFSEGCAANHYFHCKETRNLLTIAHDIVKHTIARGARDAGCPIIIEPPAENHHRTDLVISAPTMTMETDVCISDAMSPSANAKGSWDNQLQAANSRSKIKDSSHKDNVLRRGHTWIPASFERQGGFSEQAITLCSKIAEAAVNNDGHLSQPNKFYVNLVEEVAVAIARGNSLIQSIGLRDSHHHLAALDASNDALISGANLSTTIRWKKRALRASSMRNWSGRSAGRNWSDGRSAVRNWSGS